MCHVFEVCKDVKYEVWFHIHFACLHFNCRGFRQLLDNGREAEDNFT